MLFKTKLPAVGSAWWCLPVFAFFLLSTQIFAQKSSAFFIQLGAFKTVPQDKVDKVKDIASVFSEKTGKGLLRLMLGQFTSRPEAEVALKEVKKRGFPDAFVVERPAEKVPTIYDAVDIPDNQQVAPKPGPAKQSGNAYMVQVGAFSGKVPINEILALVNLGNIYTEVSGNMTKVYVGNFVNRGATADALAAVKASGFQGAFVKEVPLESVKLLIEQKQNTPQVNIPVAPRYASVQFVNSITGFTLETPSDSVEMSGSIFPVTENVLLFQGFLRIKGDMYGQTLLLRSENGGKNWNEVFLGEYGYDIVYLEFVNDKTAYLVTFGVVEGPGVLMMYRSDDGAKTWNEVAEIPKNEHYCTPSYIRMSDMQNGTAVYDCFDDALRLWSTTDGGKNWLYKGVMNKKAFEALPPYQGRSENGIYATLNGSVFFKEVPANNALIVYRLNQTANTWEENFRMSLVYRLKEGKILPF
ncbi:hypothetical protein C7N43_19660 [Sphingobacteriales bacterium UPWRP_1]|nr:hypothetical protein B6N25_12480 [Sphingobacteriales bacterium TSM_CSS]PSJ75301.1 hypothetical protein C7N43_19660 [Sphingobacteriales bacterium UPWRP_1]